MTPINIQNDFFKKNHGFTLFLTRTGQEVWVFVENTENKYQVSNFGRVKSFWKKNEEIRCLSNDKDGYKHLSICANGKAKTRRVHILVCLAFLENPENYPIINHKDLTTDNNNIGNLEWCTFKHNNQFVNRKCERKPSSYKVARRYGMYNPKNLRTMDITTGFFFDSIMQAKHELNLFASRHVLSKMVRGLLPNTTNLVKV